MQKKRLDQWLVDRAFFSSRNRAKEQILSGNVLVDGEKETRPAKRVAQTSEIQLVQAPVRNVGRGALKLREAFALFPLDVAGKVCCDLGASTGGFCQVLLEQGARLVYAVDVGHNQMQPELRSDPRIVLLEKTNARFLSPEHFPQQPQFLTGDLSFISLELVIPAFASFLAPCASGVVLVKPQFELGPGQTDRGVVRNPQSWILAIERVAGCLERNGFRVHDLGVSPVTGAAGNVEFLLYFSRGRAGGELILAQKYDTIIARALARTKQE
ncbi:MAG TPA: TlyA family RNA methyltransferase [Thermotogota bacterium]|nr:TlyA family RNA methyltransferase [Thermotogota bacterium]HRW93022.1 TlyA family RNA methyltransferase [Thermotogota bacterium]